MPTEPSAPPVLSVDQIRLGIRWRESSGDENDPFAFDYKAVNFNGDSTGAYQFKKEFWHAWAKLLGDRVADSYDEPLDAPPEVQDRMCRNALQYTKDHNSRIGDDSERLIASWLTGEGEPDKPSLAERDKSEWNQQPPDSDNKNNPTVRDYVDAVINNIREREGS